VAQDAGSTRTAPKMVNRLWRHVTRSRARAGLLLMVISVLVYALLKRWELPGHEPLEQVSLILAGVAASAVFLPELSSDLWRLSRDDVEKLVPHDRRTSLLRSLLAADSKDPAWDDLVYGQAVLPLMEAAQNPQLTVRNMDYTVEVHLDKTIKHGDRVLPIHNVETLASSERVLPQRSAAGYWVSVARTPEALDREFTSPGCLLRELVELRDEDGVPLETAQWHEVMVEHCHVGVTVNGQAQNVADPDSKPSDVVRWYFTPEGEDVAQRVPLRVSFDFPVSADVDRFPVMFSGYYCAGSTVATIKVYGLAEGVDLRCNAFFARGLDPQASGGDVKKSAGALCKQASFSTGRDSILWPGSGVIFDWHAC
jgi:hypothetical protein